MSINEGMEDETARKESCVQRRLFALEVPGRYGGGTDSMAVTMMTMPFSLSLEIQDNLIFIHSWQATEQVIRAIERSASHELSHHRSGVIMDDLYTQRRTV